MAAVMKLFGLLCVCGAMATSHAGAADGVSDGAVMGYVTRLTAESATAKAERHKRVSVRRAGQIVIVHRGATAFAPENTLEAYAAAMDYGADGCEIDVRRTSDGALVLFHDDMLDHLTNGLGVVEQLTYAELLSLKPSLSYGTADSTTRPPTLAAVLELARQRSMLIDLDVKSPGIDGDIAAVLDEADMWDHVVALSPYNTAELRKSPKLHALSFKGPGLFEDQSDWDPAAVRAALAKPGEMIIVDDPRVAARELKRPAYEPVKLPGGLRSRMKAVAQKQECVGAIQTLSTRDDSRSQPDGDDEYRKARDGRILARAVAALQLAEKKQHSAEVVRLLEYQVRNRSLHRDWYYHGLDGAMAARALGMIGATESAPVLVEAFRRIDPELKKVVNPEWGQNPLSWTDYRAKMYIIPALGHLRCKQSKAFLAQYLAMEDAAARELSPPMFAEAAEAFLRQDVAQPEIESLLRHRSSNVRGVAIRVCLDQPTKVRTAALESVAPWALKLPRAKR